MGEPGAAILGVAFSCPGRNGRTFSPECPSGYEERVPTVNSPKSVQFSPHAFSCLPPVQLWLSVLLPNVPP